MVSMSAFLTLSSLSAATPEGRTLFHDLTLSVGAERIGLVGRNGSGKSTLLRIAAGVQAPSSGSVHRGGTAAMLAQNWRSDQLIGEALGVAEALAIHARIERGEGTEADFDAVDWMLPAAVDAALADIGLAGVDIERPMGSLSGGERTRIGIARLAIERPDLLLLDEPTNNLDREGRAAIERLVATWPGGVLVASHDRALLDRMDRIVELSPIGIRIVGGGWSAFAEKGSEPKILLGAKAERAENSGGHARRLAERQIDEAVHASDAARARVEILTPLAIDLPATGIPSQAELLAMEGASVDLGGRRLGPWTMAIFGPERVALAGANGTGKSTLLRLVTGSLAPVTGMVRRRSDRIAMLDQHGDLLDEGDTIIGNMRRRHPMLGEEAIHAACARFAFRNREAQRIVGSLSGGERLRAGLAVALSGPQPPWLLILDEPTNHLDIASIEVLERALESFDGALLVVSHDRRFLDAIGIQRTVDVGRG